MKKLHVGRLHVAAGRRRPGYLDALLKVGQSITIHGMPFLLVSDANYAAIAAEFAIVKPAFVASPNSALRPKLPGLGDAIHKVAGPIGKKIKWPCLKGDGTTDLKPGSPCDKARRLLNKISMPG